MSHEALHSQYPVIGSFVGALLTDAPDAARKTISELSQSAEPIETYPVGNREFCEDYADWATSVVCESGDSKRDRAVFLRGMLWAAAITNNADSGMTADMQDMYEDTLQAKDDRYQHTFGSAFIAKDNFPLLEQTIEECRPFVDPEDKNPWYARVGMLVGFMMVENGQRRQRAREEARAAAEQAMQRAFRLIAEAEADTFANVQRDLL